MTIDQIKRTQKISKSHLQKALRIRIADGLLCSAWRPGGELVDIKLSDFFRTQRSAETYFMIFNRNN